MASIANDVTSTNISSTSSAPTGCPNCPTFTTNGGNSSSYENMGPLLELVSKNIADVDRLQKEILEVEKNQEKSLSFYQAIKKLANTSRAAILILIAVPIIQLIACIITIVVIGAQDKLSSLLNWAIGSIGVLSFAEVIIAYTKLAGLEKSVEKLEAKVEKLEDRK